MFRYEQGEDTFVIDPAELSTIEFPIFFGKGVNAYYVPSGKGVTVPIRLKFAKRGATDESVFLEGSAALPKSEPAVKARCKVGMQVVCNAFLYAFENECSLLSDPVFSKYAYAVVDAIAEEIKDCNYNFIMMDVPYKYPSFVFIGNELVAVSEGIILHEQESGVKTLDVFGLKGPYISVMKTNADKNVKIIVLDEQGEKLTEISAKVTKLTDDGINADFQEVVHHGNVAMLKECQSIYDEYKENYISYFIDKQDKKESEVDISGIFIES